MDNIIIKEDVMLDSKENITFHFTYDENLTLKELAEALDLTNRAINAFNEENGVKSRSVLGKKYATEITAVKSGSVVVEMLITCAGTVALSVLANFIYDKLKTVGSSDKQKKEHEFKYPINIVVNGNNNKNIDIHIHNRNNE